NIPTYGSLAGKYIEVVLPKVDHYFLKLSFGIRRSQDSICSDLGHQLSSRLKVIFSVEIIELLATFALLCLCHLFVVLLRGVVICLGLSAAFELAKQGAGIRILCKYLCRRQAECIKALELCLGRRVIDRRCIELLLDK